MKIEKNRNRSIDIMKGLLIVLVVLGHSQAPVHRFIYLFHMAAFFIISGYLWKDDYSKTKKSLLILIKKRLYSLYRPYIICNLVFVLISIVVPELFQFRKITRKVHYIGINVIKIMLLHGRTLLSDATWFIAVLFVISIIYGILIYCGKNIQHIVFFKITISLISLIIAGFFSYSNFNFGQVGTVFSALAMFSIGDVIKKVKFDSVLEKLMGRMSILIVTFLILIGLLLIEKKEVRMIDNSYPNIVYFFIAGVLGYLFIRECANYLEKFELLSNIFTLLGQKSIYIMCIHMLAFKIVIFIQCLVYNRNFKFLSSYPVLKTGGLNCWWMLYTFVGIIVPLIYGYIYEMLTSSKCVTKVNNLRLNEPPVR